MNDEYEKEFQDFKKKNIELKEKINNGELTQEQYMEWLISIFINITAIYFICSIIRHKIFTTILTLFYFYIINRSKFHQFNYKSLHEKMEKLVKK